MRYKNSFLVVILLQISLCNGCSNKDKVLQDTTELRAESAQNYYQETILLGEPEDTISSIKLLMEEDSVLAVQHDRGWGITVLSRMDSLTRAFNITYCFFNSPQDKKVIRSDSGGQRKFQNYMGQCSGASVDGYMQIAVDSNVWVTLTDELIQRRRLDLLNVQLLKLYPDSLRPQIKIRQTIQQAYVNRTTTTTYVNN